jgi:hypothetical protein
MTAPIDLAIEDLTSQPRPNFLATAQKYAVNITTLRRRFAGEITHNRLTLA